MGLAGSAIPRGDDRGGCQRSSSSQACGASTFSNTACPAPTVIWRCRRGRGTVWVNVSSVPPPACSEVRGATVVSRSRGVNDRPCRASQVKRTAGARLDLEIPARDREGVVRVPPPPPPDAAAWGRARRVVGHHSRGLEPFAQLLRVGPGREHALARRRRWTMRSVRSSGTAATLFPFVFRLVWSGALEIGLELVELLLPETAVLLDPVGGGPQALAAQLAAPPLRLGWRSIRPASVSTLRCRDTAGSDMSNGSASRRPWRRPWPAAPGWRGGSDRPAPGRSERAYPYLTNLLNTKVPDVKRHVIDRPKTRGRWRSPSR